MIDSPSLRALLRQLSLKQTEVVAFIRKAALEKGIISEDTGYKPALRTVKNQLDTPDSALFLLAWMAAEIEHYQALEKPVSNPPIPTAKAGRILEQLIKHIVDLANAIDRKNFDHQEDVIKALTLQIEDSALEQNINEEVAHVLTLLAQLNAQNAISLGSHELSPNHIDRLLHEPMIDIIPAIGSTAHAIYATDALLETGSITAIGAEWYDSLHLGDTRSSNSPCYDAIKQLSGDSQARYVALRRAVIEIPYLLVKQEASVGIVFRDRFKQEYGRKQPVTTRCQSPGANHLSAKHLNR